MARPPFSPLPAAVLLLAVLLLPVLAAPAGEASAQALCSEPVEPICATAIPATDPNAATDQGVARNRCLEDAETYREKLQDYHGCLQSSLDSARAGIEAADRFIACLEGGKADCRLDGTR